MPLQELLIVQLKIWLADEHTEARSHSPVGQVRLEGKSSWLDGLNAPDCSSPAVPSAEINCGRGCLEHGPLRKGLNASGHRSGTLRWLPAGGVESLCTAHKPNALIDGVVTLWA